MGGTGEPPDLGPEGKRGLNGGVAFPKAATDRGRGQAIDRQGQGERRDLIGEIEAVGGSMGGVRGRFLSEWGL